MVATKVALRSSTRPKNVFNPTWRSFVALVECFANIIVVVETLREANSFLTSCQRVGGYGVASGWCPLSTTRSDHFQLDVPFIFVKWIYNIKSGPRWKWISRMHQISFLCWNGDDVGEFRRLSRWSEPETVSSGGDSVCTWSTVCKFPSLPNFLWLQQALHWTCERQCAWKDFAIICLRIYGLVTLQIDSSSEPHFPDRRPKGWTPPPPPFPL